MTAPLQIDEDLQTMLTFYHDLGRIIYFGSLSKDKSALNDIVILDPQWLVDVFKQVIRLSKPKETVTWLHYCYDSINVVRHHVTRIKSEIIWIAQEARKTLGKLNFKLSIIFWSAWEEGR